ncbi:hypothetical protein TW81_17995 [Vibrio galatheae]|uniref:diguanylate cyclase n=1 Tax=Vibrio galatheae TaxID=579748 RepID=A0A0F4NF27_9VIBR|nr:GGDEF domain-containing protein [Vibrio galatheae]KJY81448.1 hypothetical protein TW81_17995 [Vibrio galatheae]
MEEIVFNESNKNKSFVIKFAMACTLLVSISIVVALNIIFTNPIENILSENYGYIFEFLVLVLLIVIFSIIQVTPLNRKNYLTISIGLIIWIISCTIDFMDEIFYQPLWLSVWGEDLLRSIGMIICIVGLHRLVKSVKRYISEIKRLAIYDDLTDLPNRRFFKEVLSRYENMRLTMIIIDLDHFKSVNDTYGHEKGDTVLRAFGKLLSSMNLPNSMSARLGGEEFAVFIETHDRTLIDNYISQLLVRSRSISISKDQHLTVSAGISLKTEKESAHHAMKRADSALYIAKGNGRNRYEWSSE